jgi:FixJ family two-component response regulator
MVRQTAIVEDEEVLRGSVAAILASAGYGSAEFENAEQFIKAVEGGERFDYWIIDINLPGMRGDDMVIELVRRKAVETARVFILSGLEDDEIVNAKCRIEPFVTVVDCLTKPIEAETFVQRIQHGMGADFPQTQTG